MPFEDFTPTSLHQTFTSYHSAAGRSAVSTACRENVTCWKWGRGEMWRPEPFRKEWFGATDRWLRWWERPKLDDLRCGLDAVGKVQLAEQWSANDRRLSSSQAETYVVYQPNAMETVRYRYSDRPEVELIHRFEFQNERLQRMLALGRMFCTERRFVWNGDRLEKVVSMGWNHRYSHSSGEWEDLRVTSQCELNFQYSPRGRLVSIQQVFLNSDRTPCNNRKPLSIYPVSPLISSH